MLIRVVAVLCILSFGCQAATTIPSASRTMPEPVAATALPASPLDQPIAPGDDWALALDDVPVGPGDRRSGVLLSDAKAERAARLLIAYNELRALYATDIRTWEREREVYERMLEMSDEEIRVVRARAERTWWERHGAATSLAAGLLLGIGLSVGVGVGASR